MDVVVEILGRATLNDEFAVISSQTVTLACEAVTFFPSVPDEAKGQDLRLRLHSPVHQPVKVNSCRLDIANRPDSIGIYASYGGVSQLFPFRGDVDHIVVARAGVALP